MRMRLLMSLPLLLGAWGTRAPAAPAQEPTQRPLRLVVPFPPGGVTDVLARIIGSNITEKTGQQAVIDNRAGASGIIGTAMVAKAPPDGHTLLVATASHATVGSLYAKVPFDAVKDFEPVALIATLPYVLVVHPSLQVKSVTQLIDYAKARPGKLSVAGSAPGLAQHLGWELFKRMSATDIVYVPYKGSALQMPDLLAGRVQAAIDSLLILVPHMKTGALQGLAVTSAARSPLLPDLPTVAEVALPGFQASGWFGVFAPAKTPADVVRKLNGQIAAIMQQPDVRERLVAQGVEPVSGSPAQMRKWLAQEVNVWSKVIRDAGLKLD
jgi:tripartite-type tricarboxylate transporter receptor subunit TctC